jgi:DNA-binding NarL/FixJ family response regulator
VVVGCGRPSSSRGMPGTFAVTIHPAGVRAVLGIICRAYGLTAREREVVELIAEGLDTNDDIAKRLYISPYTVQDHLKSTFEKVGVNSPPATHGRSRPSQLTLTASHLLDMQLCECGAARARASGSAAATSPARVAV